MAAPIPTEVYYSFSCLPDLPLPINQGGIGLGQCLNPGQGEPLYSPQWILEPSTWGLGGLSKIL